MRDDFLNGTPFLVKQAHRINQYNCRYRARSIRKYVIYIALPRSGKKSLDEFNCNSVNKRKKKRLERRSAQPVGFTKSVIEKPNRRNSKVENKMPYFIKTFNS